VQRVGKTPMIPKLVSFFVVSYESHWVFPHSPYGHVSSLVYRLEAIKWGYMQYLALLSSSLEYIGTRWVPRKVTAAKQRSFNPRDVRLIDGMLRSASWTTNKHRLRTYRGNVSGIGLSPYI
jgi:hypothetical protein